MLVVCHNPGIADFALRICGSGDAQSLAHMEMKYPTSGLARSSTSETRPGRTSQWGQGSARSFRHPSMLVEGVDDLD